MNRLAVFALFLLVACDEKPADPNRLQLSKQPISVRGWITDVGDAPAGDTFRTVETEAARRIGLFQQTNVWVENAPYVSGGVAETGAYILLDVPPGDVTVSFTAPGAENAQLKMSGIPGSADVLIPEMLLKPGTAELLRPDLVRVRIAARIDKPRPTGRNATIAGRAIPIIEVPLKEMMDRRDWPTPPGMGQAPVATVK